MYSDEFISDEDALQEFKNHLNSEKMTVYNPNRVTNDLNFRQINFRTGIHERTWVKNVLAIGLSAAFIEPLESNGLFSVQCSKGLGYGCTGGCFVGGWWTIYPR